MQNGTGIALSRLMAQQRAMDVTANNIANANTPGYRAARMLFSDWLLREPGGARVAGEKAITYTQDRATWRDQRGGGVASTGNPLDLAIGDPSGYFTVRAPGGTRLTRSGHFTLSPAGAIVDADGNALLDKGGQAITLSAADTRVTIAGDGTVSSENGPIASVAVVTPADANRLTDEGDRLALANTPTTPTVAPHIVQGAVEGSNVQAVAETTRMMSDLREFQFVAQYVQAESERMNGAIEKLSQRPG